MQVVGLLAQLYITSKDVRSISLVIFCVDCLAGLGQLGDETEALGLDKNCAAALREEGHIRATGLGVEFVFVAGRVVDGPAQRGQQGIDKLMHHTGFGDQLLLLGAHPPVFVDQLADADAGFVLGNGHGGGSFWWGEVVLLAGDPAFREAATK